MFFTLIQNKQIAITDTETDTNKFALLYDSKFTTPELEKVFNRQGEDIKDNLQAIVTVMLHHLRKTDTPAAALRIGNIVADLLGNDNTKSSEPPKDAHLIGIFRYLCTYAKAQFGTYKVTDIKKANTLSAATLKLAREKFLKLEKYFSKKPNSPISPDDISTLKLMCTLSMKQKEYEEFVKKSPLLSA